MARKLDSPDDKQPPVSDVSESTSTGTGNSVLNRRTYMKLGLTAISARSAETVIGSPSKSVSRHGIEFQSSRDAVDDLGMDPTGTEPIDERLKQTLDGELLRFPNGTYRFDGRPNISIRSGTRGFEGIGDDVTFCTSEEAGGFLLDASEMDGVYVSNLALDQRPSHSCLGVRLTGKRVICEDVELVGDCGRPAGGVPLISHATESVTGQSLVKDIVATGGCSGHAASRRPGIFVEQSHEGTLTVRDCDLRRFPNAAVHAIRHSGRIHVIDSYFENNAAGIRLTNPSSRIDRCEIVLNELPLPVEGSPTHNLFRLHAIAVGSGEDGSGFTGSLSISNSNIQIERVRNDVPAVVTASSGTAVELENCRVVFNNDGRSVVCAVTPGSERERSVGPLHVQDSVIQGNGRVSSTVLAENADGTTFVNSSINLAGGDGITIVESEGCDITHANIDVPGHAGVFGDSSVAGSAIGYDQSVGPESRSGSEVSGAYDLKIDTIDPPTWYELTVDGQLEPNSVGVAKRSVSGENAEGVVASEPVSYTIDGEITDFRLGEGGRVYINENNVDKNELGQGYPHRLIFDGTGTNTTYAFSTTTLSPRTPRTGEKNQIRVTDTDAVDQYRFAGPLEALSIDGTAKLSFSSSEPSS